MLDIQKFSTNLLIVLAHKYPRNPNPTKKDLQALAEVISDLETAEKFPPDFIMNQEKFSESIVRINNRIARTIANQPKGVFWFFHVKTQTALKMQFICLIARLLSIEKIPELFDDDLKNAILSDSFLDKAFKLLAREYQYVALEEDINKRLPVQYDKIPFALEDSQATATNSTIIYDKIPVFTKETTEPKTQKMVREGHRERLLALVRDVEAEEIERPDSRLALESAVEILPDDDDSSFQHQ